MKTTTVVADWKETEELINGFKKAIRKLGGYVYNHPDFKGSDTYGFIVSDEALTKKQIKENHCFPKSPALMIEIKSETASEFYKKRKK